MKLSLTLGDTRQKSQPAYVQRVEFEEYDRVSVDSLDAPPAVIAAILRGIADDIDPARTVSSVSINPQKWVSA